MTLHSINATLPVASFCPFVPEPPLDSNLVLVQDNNTGALLLNTSMTNDYNYLPFVLTLKNYSDYSIYNLSASTLPKTLKAHSSFTDGLRQLFIDGYVLAEPSQPITILVEDWIGRAALDVKIDYFGQSLTVISALNYVCEDTRNWTG